MPWRRGACGRACWRRPRRQGKVRVKVCRVGAGIRHVSGRGARCRTRMQKPLKHDVLNGLRHARAGAGWSCDEGPRRQRWRCVCDRQWQQRGRGSGDLRG